jgi:hypothetical protein
MSGTLQNDIVVWIGEFKDDGYVATAMVLTEIVSGGRRTKV